MPGPGGETKQKMMEPVEMHGLCTESKLEKNTHTQELYREEVARRGTVERRRLRAASY